VRDIEDFQESVYAIDEFWLSPDVQGMALSRTEQPLMCPAASSRLESRQGTPCSAGGVGPQRNISVGFNKRLETRTRYVNGSPYPASAYPTSRILSFPDVPLAFDVDGEDAVDRGMLPYNAAPPILDDEVEHIHESGQCWFSAFRHRGRMNVGFVAGHILSSRRPLTEPW